MASQHSMQEHFGVRYRMSGVRVPGICGGQDSDGAYTVHLLFMLLSDAERQQIKMFRDEQPYVVMIRVDRFTSSARPIKRYKPIHDSFTRFLAAIPQPAFEDESRQIHTLSIRRDVARDVMLNYDPAWGVGFITPKSLRVHWDIEYNYPFPYGFTETLHSHVVLLEVANMVWHLSDTLECKAEYWSGRHALVYWNNDDTITYDGLTLIGNRLSTSLK